MRKSRSHRRAESQTQLTASIPKELKRALKEMAKSERRSLSNWLVIELEKVIEGKLAPKIVKIPAGLDDRIVRVAEPEAKYPSGKKGKRR